MCSTGTHVTYDFFMTNQPNGGTYQNCMLFESGQNFFMNDVICGFTSSRILCEKDAQ